LESLVGQTLGQYQIVEQVGQGGMATVYKAYQPGLNRYVAVKVLPPIHAKQPGFSERFRREAKAIANLNHPNILPIYDSGQEGEYSFIVMRYVEDAHTLKQVMETRLSLRQITGLIEQIAAALDYAHRQGVIHRDVKPSNVLVDNDWALLTDFGLAKMTEDSVRLTGTGVGIGTPAYMSPEQGQGQSVDHRTDIYALGVILFEMLTGQIPHNAETPVAIVFKRATEPLPLPRALNPNITKAVERVVLKALAREPDDRFTSAGTLATALKEAVSGTDAEGLKTSPFATVELPSGAALPAQTAGETVVLPSTSEVSAPVPARRLVPWSWMVGIGGLAIAVALLFIALVSGGRPPTLTLLPGPTATTTLAPNEWGFPEHLWVIWNDIEGEGNLGAPGPINYRSNYSRQPFEGGFMLWWDNPDGTDHIWILGTGGNNWSRYDNTWTPDDPIFPPDCPDAQDPYGPMMGFGKIWCDYPSVRDGMGAALEKESASNDAIVQFFEKGVRFYFPAHEEIWVLFFDGTWKKYD
jgi:tRNA A-37 threonylcarbamoyl transferase component Bud32